MILFSLINICYLNQFIFKNYAQFFIWFPSDQFVDALQKIYVILYPSIWKLDNPNSI